MCVTLRDLGPGPSRSRPTPPRRRRKRDPHLQTTGVGVGVRRGENRDQPRGCPETTTFYEGHRGRLPAQWCPSGLVVGGTSVVVSTTGPLEEHPGAERGTLGERTEGRLGDGEKCEGSRWPPADARPPAGPGGPGAPRGHTVVGPRPAGARPPVGVFPRQTVRIHRRTPRRQ